MAALIYNTVLEPITELSVIKRRPVGKGAWRMTLQQVIESERGDLSSLRRLSEKYPHDAELQRIVAQLYAEHNERAHKLWELMNYRGEGGEGKE